MVKKGKELKLKEQGHRQMTLTGSTFINVLIEEHVRKELPYCYDDWKKKQAAIAAQFLHANCEQAKRRFKGNNIVKLELPNTLLRLVSDEVRPYNVHSLNHQICIYAVQVLLPSPSPIAIAIVQLAFPCFGLCLKV